MAKLYLLAFAGLLLACQLASAAEPAAAADPAHKNKPPGNKTADAKPTKPAGSNADLPKAPKAPAVPAKGKPDVPSGPWSKPSAAVPKGAKGSNHTAAGGVKPAAKRHGGHDGNGSSGKLLNGRKSFFIDPYTPLFTKSEKKLATLSTVRFTNQLAREISWFQPLFVTNGTQVHIGFWSGPGNHGKLVGLLDSINGQYCPPRDATKPKQCAAWDEGVDSSTQMPSYVEMLVEQWYTRGSDAAQNSPNVTIYAGNYKNINPLNFETADQIWGAYSQRYADTARNYFLRTGKRVKAWCYVQGAGAKRIFFRFERPELQILEAEGVVEVMCAKTPNADWQVAADWDVGTSSPACTPPAAAMAEDTSFINVANRK